MRSRLDELPLLNEIEAKRRERRGVTWRSLLAGSIGVALVCGLTPYNDFVLSDTSLVAGFLPVAAVLILFALIVLINAPLHRVAPRHALNSRELAVALLMVLVSCGLPNWGLMRFFIPTPVAPFHIAAADQQFWNAFAAMNLPKWLFPVANVQQGPSDDVVRWFYTRVPDDERIPYRAWLVPLVTWGVFIAAMLATLTSMARLLFDQWAANERLPFPLVQVQSALIEDPPPGRGLNDLFRSPVLWIGLIGIFFVHSLSALNSYEPKYFPKIPTGYDFSAIFGDPPWFYLDTKVKKATISFMIVGATFFIRSRAAFSLWAIYLITNIVQVAQAMTQGESSSAAQADEHLGACVAFIGGMLWIGRHHWIRVLRNAFGLSGGDRTYRLAFWIAAIGMLVMIGWLRVVGVQWWLAVAIVVFIVAAHVVVARVVAETGLPFYRTSIAVSQAYTNMPIGWFSGRDVYFANVFTVLGPLTTRDSVLAFTLHGQGVCRDAGVEKRETRAIGGVIAWALCLGFVIAALATLYCQYSYPTPAMADATPARNYFGAEYIPRRDVANAFVDFSNGHFPAKAHNPAVHVGVGFGVTLLLQMCALRWAGWPLLPIGFVTSYGAFIGNAWFSVFLGWLAKVLIIRFGGSSLLQRARPFFIGIIFGEALAAGIWLVVNAIIVMHGGESQTMKFLAP